MSVSASSLFIESPLYLQISMRFCFFSLLLIYLSIFLPDSLFNDILFEIVPFFRRKKQIWLDTSELKHVSHIAKCLLIYL